ncbi:Calcineurin-like phosphoesterase [Filomicrobium insigne]|uniref:Calcineurin-like phosphoesterase n=1 Tax=Filomicrobium insigne TaxID=418854 RepID=A0A1H0GS53_9HYPH|nr:metallophosphoesterase [Filomicrobium insigne]SDO09664.1 Calcineurin-like phosphoesterase [Filomicrobium insigne]
MPPLFDPRLGDIEDDASSPKRRSLFAIAGSLLAEISLPKLLAAWLLLIVVPGVLLGLAPLVASGWVALLSRKIITPLDGIWPLFLIVLVIALGWLGWRPLFRIAERGFWSLNSLVVQPSYALCREGLRHLVEHMLMRDADAESRARLRATTAAGAGIVLCGLGIWIVMLAWPSSRWVGDVADLTSPHRLLVPALANTVVVLGSYLAVSALAWGIADAVMAQPRDLPAFDEMPEEGRIWRVAHLSDLHVVGERFGFRIESGRSGPRGNDRLEQILEELAKIHSQEPLDHVLITGDMTDAGRSAEWAEFFAALSQYPELEARTLVLPGNHDVNVVDRANPARLDLPTSPGLRLRQIRALSAIAAVQGEKVHVVDSATGRIGQTLSATLAPHAMSIADFANSGALRHSSVLSRIWTDVFPMVLPPDDEDGLGVILLNSNAETHFSFTNALGFMSAEQASDLAAVTSQFPHAHWIVALHHHIVEYPEPVTDFSKRIGTALINGTWFVRQIQPLASRIVAMHGHRHMDWVGECGGVRIISAPSPVMASTGNNTVHFYVHLFGKGMAGRLSLLKPERVELPGMKT